ncbi:SRPBCC domain-containing protein [Shouchella patagoniensis]|uniref:SRPBCC domain-containing protein n=1 Tax=Shouchella patagoniensis TaxID=228576 RepID=UPI000995C4FE|nr:SRPBCC domain-containing protein [Shouchella patagoniensis]
MGKELSVRTEILIHASPAYVWEVLVNPKYVAEWDELPEDYPTERMTVGSKVIWDLPNGEQSITKIIKADKEKELVIALLGTGWEMKPTEGDVAYHYTLIERGDKTLVTLCIGDFSLLKDGQMYYDASVEFADNAKTTIKRLAESMQDFRKDLHL